MWTEPKMQSKWEKIDLQVRFDGATEKIGNFELHLSSNAKLKETGVSRVESPCHLKLSACLINIKF